MFLLSMYRVNEWFNLKKYILIFCLYGFKRIFDLRFYGCVDVVIYTATSVCKSVVRMYVSLWDTVFKIRYRSKIDLEIEKEIRSGFLI